MDLIISIVQAKVTRMKSELCLGEDTERLEDKIVLGAFMLKIDFESVKSDVILLAKLKTTLKTFTR